VPQLAAIKLWIAALSPWRSRGLLIVAGLISAAALPPLHLVFLLIPSLTVLVWITEQAETKRQAFGAGWWFGLGHFAAGLYWVSLSFLVDIAAHGWMAPFAIVGLAGGMALFLGLPTLGVFTFKFRGAATVLGLAAFWVLTEWLRSWIFTGFPWNLSGSIWTFSDAMIQPAALVGTYGLSLITIAAAASPATLAQPIKKAAMPSLAFAIILGGVWGWGTWRLSAAEDQNHPGIHLRIVQPNIAQADKWKSDLRPKHVRTLLDLSSRDSGVRPTHIIWPETAVPYFVNREAGIRSAMAAALPQGGALITGAPSATPREDQPFKVSNSVIVVDDQGSVSARYDKTHLVPFGEYVPFRSILPLEKLTAGRADFTPGPELTSLTIPGLPTFSPLICYEVIFPGQVIAAGERPSWLLNLTNDAWFGTSSGPYQHLAATRLRAVEEGLPLVRVANTGISALIDSYGRIKGQIGLNQQGILDVGLPKPMDETTLYGALGNSLPLGLCGLFLLLSYGLNRRRQ